MVVTGDKNHWPIARQVAQADRRAVIVAKDEVERYLHARDGRERHIGWIRQRKRAGLRT